MLGIKTETKFSSFDYKNTRPTSPIRSHIHFIIVISFPGCIHVQTYIQTYIYTYTMRYIRHPDISEFVTFVRAVRPIFICFVCVRHVCVCLCVCVIHVCVVAV